MKVSFETAGAVQGGALAVFVTQGALQTETVQSLDATTGGQVTRALKSNRFNGEAGQVLELLAPAGLEANRLLLVGLGQAAKVTASDLEKAGGSVYARLATSGETALTLNATALEGVSVDAGEAAARLGLGARLRSYRFDRYRTKEPASKKPTLEAITVWTGDAAGAESRYAKLAAVADGVFFTRDLVSEPGNALYPKSFAERAQALTDLGVKVEVLGETQLRELGFGALLGVSQGSANEPQVVILEYDGAGGDTPPVVFVGKGVTFDTGGISIKPAAGMEGMKWDMGGAGAVIGAVRALAARKAKCRVVGLCGMVENMPSGTAQRPGDVVKSYSGQTIEVINTDAEGRLVLCDVMAYAQDRYKPKVMVDLATLTGAMIISLGHEYGGMFSNDDTLAAQLDAAGKASGDKLWRMPMGDPYDKLINTPIADMKNVGPREAGSITAAQFLQRFVKEGVAWAHLDIAGMVWSDKDTALWEKGATGYGVRLLDQFIADNHEAK
ncbi:leucyl aminopeptidase [Pedomonas mirosovicensis]|uniref:leucyl aminopeptidase n=1 Tax=Pedomonas mirosovicensis TaxID=2908641 RepID=UPI002166F540|nr:leucyl aminopeptidase [Pedomonas mirosovicensis]MCH8685305.1 leucyl aminopeptidase [Pedomonas mirosovicensis]